MNDIKKPQHFVYSTHQILCVLYEIRNEPTTLGGAVGIPPNGLRLLHRLNLYEKVAAKGAETPKIVMHSLKGSDMGSVDIVSWSQEKTGFGYMRVRRTDLMEVYLSAANDAGIPIHYGKQLVGIEERDNQVTAKFADGTTDTADFLIGCDGIHSSVRKLYVDPDCTPTYSGISNVYSLISTADLKPAASSLNNLNATLTSDGLIAVTPTTPARDILYWFFSREIPFPTSGDTRDGREERGRSEIQNLKSMLLELLGGSKSEWIDVLHDIVNNTETVKFYPVYKMPTGRPWSKGRCLIIGDAAHAMPPHASQGVSMAFEDVFLFSKLLKNHYYRIEDALLAYEQKRKTRVEEMLRTTERNGEVRKKATPWRLWASGLAISGALWIYNLAGLERLGMGQKALVYDVEEEQFEP